MKRLFFGFLLGIGALSAQNALLIDLSGSWRRSFDDHPYYAKPDMDDSGWARVELPWKQRPPRGVYWLRKTVELFPATERTQLALTLGPVREVYEVYVNGKLIGSTGEFNDDAVLRARQRTFDIPAEAVRDASRLLIAIRSRSPEFRRWNSISGLYQFTYRWQSRADENEQQLSASVLVQAAQLLLGVLLLFYAIVLFLIWLSGRERPDLLWLWLFLLASSAHNLLAYLGNVYPELQIRQLEGLEEAFDGSALAGLVMAYTGIRLGWQRIIIWAFWSSLILAPVATQRLICIAGDSITLAILCFGWWRCGGLRVSRERLITFAVLAATVAVHLNRYASVISTNFQAIGLRWGVTATTITALATVLTVLILRSLVADRREKQRLAGELEAARVIQQWLLKRPEMRSAELSLEAVYGPAQEVGGDFYYVLDGQLVVIGDVSGKGLKAAMLVSLLIGVLRATSQRLPSGVLDALNRATAGQIENGFVTCCCARFDASGIVTIANAGHLSPYLDGAEVEIETGLPLGLDAETLYAETTISLPPGGSLTFLSDGVVEAADAKGDLFGFERTRAISLKSAAEIARAAQTFGQNDDITVVTVRRVA